MCVKFLCKFLFLLIYWCSKWWIANMSWLPIPKWICSLTQKLMLVYYDHFVFFGIKISCENIVGGRYFSELSTLYYWGNYMCNLSSPFSPHYSTLRFSLLFWFPVFVIQLASECFLKGCLLTQMKFLQLLRTPALPSKISTWRGKECSYFNTSLLSLRVSYSIPPFLFLTNEMMSYFLIKLGKKRLKIIMLYYY